MALITCGECARQISDQAAACPNCGCPTAHQPDTDQRRQALPTEARIQCYWCGQLFRDSQIRRGYTVVATSGKHEVSGLENFCQQCYGSNEASKWAKRLAWIPAVLALPISYWATRLVIVIVATMASAGQNPADSSDSNCLPVSVAAVSFVVVYLVAHTVLYRLLWRLIFKP